MELQEECETDRRFSCCHGQDEQEHDLPIRLSPMITSGDERETACVQHDLDAHQGKNQITPRQKSDQTQREQRHCQKQHVFGRHWHRIAPPL